MNTIHKITLIALLIPTLCFGWGSEGHRITGAIAEMYMKDVTRSKINQILGYESVEDISNWLDWKRDDWGSASPFHYISMPPDATEFKSEHCASKGVCAVSMIMKYKKRLQDKYESKEAKAEALKIIVHLFEDLHMPLHTGGKKGDYGGNGVKVVYFGKETNLHKVFDFEEIQHSGKSEEQIVYELTKDLTKERIQHIQYGTLTDWINDSHKHVVPIYDRLPKPKGEFHVLDQAYADYVSQVINEQMLEAGIRLAKYLDEIMGPVVID